MNGQNNTAFHSTTVRDSFPPLLWLVMAALIAMAALMLAPIPT